MVTRDAIAIRKSILLAFADFLDSTYPPKANPLAPDSAVSLLRESFDAMERATSGLALKGLDMAINDYLDEFQDIDEEARERLDRSLRLAGLPSYSDLSLTKDRLIMSVISRNRISDEVEYYACKNLLSNTAQRLLREAHLAVLEAAVADYETRASGSAG